MSHLEKLELYQRVINELRPFEGEMLKKIKAFYRIGLTWTSNALGGNSFTIGETKVLTKDELIVGGQTPNLMNKRFVLSLTLNNR